MTRLVRLLMVILVMTLAGSPRPSQQFIDWTATSYDEWG